MGEEPIQRTAAPPSCRRFRVSVADGPAWLVPPPSDRRAPRARRSSSRCSSGSWRCGRAMRIDCTPRAGIDRAPARVGRPAADGRSADSAPVLSRTRRVDGRRRLARSRWPPTCPPRKVAAHPLPAPGREVVRWKRARAPAHCGRARARAADRRGALCPSERRVNRGNNAVRGGAPGASRLVSHPPWQLGDEELACGPLFVRRACCCHAFW